MPDTSMPGFASELTNETRTSVRYQPFPLGARSGTGFGWGGAVLSIRISTGKSIQLDPMSSVHTHLVRPSFVMGTVVGQFTLFVACGFGNHFKVTSVVRHPEQSTGAGVHVYWAPIADDAATTPRTPATSTARKSSFMRRALRGVRGRGRGWLRPPRRGRGRRSGPR